MPNDPYKPYRMIPWKFLMPVEFWTSARAGIHHHLSSVGNENNAQPPIKAMRAAAEGGRRKSAAIWRFSIEPGLGYLQSDSHCNNPKAILVLNCFWVNAMKAGLFTISSQSLPPWDLYKKVTMLSSSPKVISKIMFCFTFWFVRNTYFTIISCKSSVLDQLTCKEEPR